MKLTDKQLQTIEDLKKWENITDPEDIIIWCKSKLCVTRKQLQDKTRKYYLEIIDYLSPHPKKEEEG